VGVLGGGIAAALLTAERGAATPSRKLRVVAAESVYGNIAAQIGGNDADVESVLTNPNADPHLFEAGSQTGLAVARAQLVVQNGLGYDAFMTKLEAAAPNAVRRVLTIADVLGVRGAGANPHFWYDVPRLQQIAAAIEAAMGRADPKHREEFAAGLRRFASSLAPLRREVTAMRAQFSGTPVAYTEPVPGYLVAAAGLVNRAPAGFTRAIEEGREPSPQDVSSMTRLLSQRHVRVLLYNAQAVSPITQRLREVAHAAGVPVVPVRETLPPRLSFQQWQLAQARALAAALAW
jgi:zinc/manganese transport system substrate-binding protein